MKKAIVIGLGSVLVLTASASFVSKRFSNGKAGNTGSPSEGTCSSSAGGCHSGGTSAVSGATVLATPAFSGNQYVPGTVYSVSLTVGALGFTKFGFGCEVLNSTNADAGTMQAPGVGTKFLVAANGRNNAVHNGMQTGASGFYTFTFNWTAPAAGAGTVKFFYCALAANGNGGTSGDLPIPGSLTLSESSTAGINELFSKTQNIDLSTFPNPAKEFINVRYNTEVGGENGIEIVNVQGEVVKNMTFGYEGIGSQSHFLSLKGIAAGIYFVRIKQNNAIAGQSKLVID